jgi:hypothetical protein
MNEHSTNHKNKSMKKIHLIILSLILTQMIFAQNKEISLKKAEKSSFKVNKSSKNIDLIEVNTNLSSISTELKSTNSGDFIVLESAGLVKTYDIGKPCIPVYSKLIEIPLEAKIKFKVISFDEETISLSEEGISNKIIPAQPSISKSEDPDKFYFDEKTYKKNEYFNNQITVFEEVGLLRSARLGRIVINPIQYNPVENKLRILNNLKVEVEFIGSNHSKTQELKSKYSSSIFDNVIEQYVQNTAIETKQLITETITYVIIADRMFESTLSSLVTHKQNLGFNVIVGYTDDSDVGSTTTSIQSYLEDLYDNPPSGYNPPHYVLLVGDVAQIPSFSSKISSSSYNDHITDLYYFDYTGDNIPDVFYGRFSASNISQLSSQISKTIEIEERSMPDASYLYEAVLVAGSDASHELTWGNGQINYATNEYYNSGNGIVAHTYLQDEPSGANYSASIISNINNGVGYANYTAHCSPSGWSNPSFSTSNISSLTNSHKYGLWVGNCCRSNRFSESECFGEAALRASGKGAVGYIGATDYTYWDEDFWWAVGYKTVTSSPSYDASHLGAFDRLFHLNGESTDDWYSTQGQMVVGGNLAVQESSSSLKLYYWEVYHLMGDPSIAITTSCGTSTVSGVISSDKTVQDCEIEVVNTTIQNNSNVILDADKTTTINGPFEVKIGSTLEIK